PTNSQSAFGLWKTRSRVMAGPPQDRRRRPSPARRSLPVAARFASRARGELKRSVALRRGGGRLGELDQVRFVDKARQLLGGQPGSVHLAKSLQKLRAGAFQRLEAVALAQVRADDLREPEVELARAPLSRQVLLSELFERRQGSYLQRGKWLLDGLSRGLFALEPTVQGIGEERRSQQRSQHPQRPVTANRNLQRWLDVAELGSLLCIVGQG